MQLLADVDVQITMADFYNVTLLGPSYNDVVVIVAVVVAFCCELTL